MNNYILAYYQAIKNGSEIAGKWTILIFEYLVRGLEDKLFYYDSKKSHRAIRFIENFCHHCEGRNDLLKLELWEKAIISAIFGIVDEKGLRQFREIFIVVARKAGKSLLAAAIANYCLYLDGEYGAKIFCIAPKLDQADIVYNAIWQTIATEPDLEQITEHRKSDYYVRLTNSSVKKIAFNQKKSDGFNPSLAICDEIAAWPGDQGLKQYEVMRSALGARKQPLILSITTANYITGGIYDELMKRSTRFLLGDSKERKLLPFLFMIDDVQKWNDINELKKANPNIGVSVSVDYMLEEIAIAEGSLSKKVEFLTKYCNIKQNSALAWLPAVHIEKASGKEIDLTKFRNCYAVGGIDLSKTTDLTCCCAIIEKNEKFNIVAQFFMPAEKLEEAIARDGIPYDIYVKRGFLKLSGDNFVNYKDCLSWFRDLIKKYKIFPLKIGYDKYCAQYLVTEMKDMGFHMDDVFQGFNLTPVIREVEGLFKDGRINIGDNDLLKIHLYNSALKLDTETEKCKLIKLTTTDRIDGSASMLDGFTVRQKFYAEIGKQLRNDRKTAI